MFQSLHDSTCLHDLTCLDANGCEKLGYLEPMRLENQKKRETFNKKREIFEKSRKRK